MLSSIFIKSLTVVVLCSYFSVLKGEFDDIKYVFESDDEINYCLANSDVLATRFFILQNIGRSFNTRIGCVKDYNKPLVV